MNLFSKPKKKQLKSEVARLNQPSINHSVCLISFIIIPYKSYIAKIKAEEKMNQMKDLENPRVILADYLRQIRYGIPGRSLVSLCLEFCYRLALFRINSMINSALIYRVDIRVKLGVKEHMEIKNSVAKDPQIARVDDAEPVATVEEAIIDAQRADHSNNNNNIDTICYREHRNNGGSNDTIDTTVEDIVETELVDNQKSPGVTQLNRGKKIHVTKNKRGRIYDKKKEIDLTFVSLNCRSMTYWSV